MESFFVSDRKAWDPYSFQPHRPLIYYFGSLPGALVSECALRIFFADPLDGTSPHRPLLDGEFGRLLLKYAPLVIIPELVQPGEVFSIEALGELFFAERGRKIFGLTALLAQFAERIKRILPGEGLSGPQFSFLVLLRLIEIGQQNGQLDIWFRGGENLGFLQDSYFALDTRIIRL